MFEITHSSKWTTLTAWLGKKRNNIEIDYESIIFIYSYEKSEWIWFHIWVVVLLNHYHCMWNLRHWNVFECKKNSQSQLLYFMSMKIRWKFFMHNLKGSRLINETIEISLTQWHYVKLQYLLYNCILFIGFILNIIYECEWKVKFNQVVFWKFRFL